MDDVNVPDKEYPQELLDAHYMDGARLHYPFEDVLHGLEVLLVEKGAFQEMSPGETPDPDRWRTLLDYIDAAHKKNCIGKCGGTMIPWSVLQQSILTRSGSHEPKTRSSPSDWSPLSDIVKSKNLHNFREESAVGSTDATPT